MEKVQKPSNSERYTPSSEPFTIKQIHAHSLYPGTLFQFRVRIVDSVPPELVAVTNGAPCMRL
jgi:hypothetical protein